MYLTADELTTTYYPKAANMPQEDRDTYLQRANSYAFGKIGGVPTFTEQLPADGLKAAVALAFEIFAKGETAQVDQATGWVTEGAPAGPFVRPPSRQYSPLEQVDVMLEPYRAAVAAANAAQAERGFRFLTGPR
jgi:hypothetical protein